MRTGGVWSLAFALIMLLTPLAIALGVVLGLIRGGSLSALKSVRVRYWPLLGLGVVLQSAEQWGDLPARLALYLVGVALLVGVTMLNVHLKGSAITGFGLTLNLMAVLVNGYVPLRADSFKAVGGMPLDAEPADWVIINGLWRFEDSNTLLRPLGDIVPVPILDDVISFGDLIMLAGLAVLATNLLLRQPRRSVTIDDLLPDEDTSALVEDNVLTTHATHSASLDLRDQQIDLDQVGNVAGSSVPRSSVQGGSVTIIESDHG